MDKMNETPGLDFDTCGYQKCHPERFDATRRAVT
jgi:hypothetical protein